MKERVSDEAVKAATERDGVNGCASWPEPKQNLGPISSLSPYLRDKYRLQPWWCQKVVSTYEEKSGRKAAGQSISAGFQIGARKTLPLPKERAWELITSPGGIKLWLGGLPDLQLAPDETTRLEMRNHWQKVLEVLEKS